MCGIAGFWDRSHSLKKPDLLTLAARMTDTLSHRGPDDAGYWADQAAGISLGHRRLAILDLSAEGHQPMHSRDGRYSIVFNGEIYNFLAIRQDLEGLGHAFRGHSDTEVMLAAFSQWGMDAAVRRFNGMFAFAVWDSATASLFLSRDRLGKKPLYYGWAGSTLLFASELKALRAHPEFRAGIDRRALALYLRLGYVPAPYSVYTGISKLPPGTLLCVNGRAPAEPVPYWSAKDAVEASLANPFRGTVENATDELEALLQDSVAIRMISDVPLGAFLSGGIDSSLVVALMHRHSHTPARTFSIGFTEEAYNEAGYAKAVAQHLRSDHTELYVSPSDAMAVIPRLPVIYDEPFADDSQIPTFLVSELARRHVTVALSGDGGDEIFGGYGNYFSTDRFVRKYAWLGRIPQRLRAGLASGMRTFAPGWREHAVHVLPADFDSYGEIHLALMSRWDPATLLNGQTVEPPTVFTDAARQAPVANFIERMMFLDTTCYLPDDILVKLDRASMAVSLESRCPILDYRVFEFAWRLPFEMKSDGASGKKILRSLLYRYVPRELLERPKQGFAIPVDEWLRGPLRDWAEDLLSHDRLKRDGLLNPAPVRRMWLHHLQGRPTPDAALWSILMLQAWLQSNEVSPDAASPRLEGATKLG